MDSTAVRSLDDVTRAMSANRAELTPEPRPNSAQQQTQPTNTIKLTARKCQNNQTVLMQKRVE